MQKRFSAVLFLALFSFQPQGTRAAETSPVGANLTIADRYQDFQKTVEASRTLAHSPRASAIAAAFAESFGPLPHRELDVLSSNDLDLLYRAAGTAAFYSYRPELATLVARLVGEFERRGEARADHYIRLQRLYIAARMLDDARRLAAEHPEVGLERVPKLRTGDHVEEEGPGSVLWALGASESSLVQTSIDLHDRAAVLVVAHPSCHFSEAAARAIESDPQLGEIFLRNSVWIAPPDGSLDMELLRVWNHEHFDLRLSFTRHHGDWPMLDTWDTPTFYFLKDGSVVSKVVGWPREGRRQELIDGARTVALVGAGESR